MLRLGMMGIALAMIGCGGSHTLDDAGDAEGIDTHESLDTMTDAPPLVRHASCAYHYGAECRVACTDAPDVPIELFIEWSSPYCCADMHFGYDDTHFRNCRCIDGSIQCLSPISGGGPEYEYAIPRTWCDLCGLSPGGRPDAYSHDASMSEDAGIPTDDVITSTEDAGLAASMSDAGT